MTTCRTSCPIQCPTRCRDFVIKQGDTLPTFVVNVSDCSGPLDLKDSVVEFNAWANAKLKKAIATQDQTIELADNIGFYSCLVGDTILVDNARQQEQLLITGFDETNKLIYVQRGYHGSLIGSYKKGTKLKIFRILNSVGETKMVYEEVEQIDGTKETLLVESQLIYHFKSQDTCVSSCYWAEFKLLKMDILKIQQFQDSPFASIASVGLCSLGQFVESVRRFPLTEGFLIEVSASPSSESLN